MSTDKAKQDKGDVTLNEDDPKTLAEAEADAQAVKSAEVETKAVHKTKDKSVHKSEDKGHAVPAHTIKSDGPSEEVTDKASATSIAAPPTVPVRAVPIFDSQEDAHDAAAKEAEEAGVTPAAVMHVSPEGASGGADY